MKWKIFTLCVLAVTAFCIATYCFYGIYAILFACFVTLPYLIGLFYWANAEEQALKNKFFTDLVIPGIISSLGFLAAYFMHFKWEDLAKLFLLIDEKYINSIAGLWGTKLWIDLFKLLYLYHFGEKGQSNEEAASLENTNASV